MLSPVYIFFIFLLDISEFDYVVQMCGNDRMKGQISMKRMGKMPGKLESRALII